MKRNRICYTQITKLGLIFLFAILCSKAFAQPLKKLNMGLTEPQIENLPKSKAPIKFPERVPKIKIPGTLTEKSAGTYKFSKGWEMLEAYKVTGSGESVFSTTLNTSEWYNATVPGTVLTTLVDQGVYPDPYFGINNMVIPDTLCRMDWWYRIMFDVPANHVNEKSWITFNGINYAAEIWLNSKLLGTVNGAFLQKKFDVTGIAVIGKKNILAIRVIPPPNPGYPEEESQATGPGRNGGALDLDGPTFISSLGWDWMPGIRDRNIGIWQDVLLSFSREVTIGYPQIITDLPLPDTTSAALTVRTELTNHSNQNSKVLLQGKLETIEFEQEVELKPGENKIISFAPQSFPQLNLKNPRLWWPNGAGEQNLYKMELSVKSDGKLSDQRTIRFGVRELSYDLTVDAPSKPAWRVEYNPLAAADVKTLLFDTDKRREVYPSPPSSVPEQQRVWIPTLKTNNTTAFKELADTSLSPFMVLKINGRRIFCKGGNWGMDDAMKRVSRERMEPAFRLHKEANFNMVRNWTGESTEEEFYELADEYGLLVWNDFWLSKDFQDLDVFNTRLFLDNARNVVKRYRNHPSIVIWCARNEGFPLKTLSEGCAQIVLEEDGTRHYTPSSRHLNLSRSGPWVYYPNPQTYAKDVHGFNTEVGIPSVPTAESMRTMMAEEDLWPISDVWAYHDFHETGAWNRQAYRASIETLYGKSENLEEFCQKAQLVNYESHKAMYEAWNNKLWNDATGVMLWMSHPAWPSTNWQIYSWDFETLGSYYGSKKACEPVHIQMDLTSRKVDVVNTTLLPIPDAKVVVKIYDPNAKMLFTDKVKINVKEDQLNDGNLIVPELKEPNYLVVLELYDSKGRLISENRYWTSVTKPKREFLGLNNLQEAKFDGKLITEKTGNKTIVQIKNSSKNMAVSVKLNLREAATDKRILPAYFEDGYFTMLPGETRKITLDVPADVKGKAVKVTAEAYNAKSQVIGEPFTVN